MAVINETMARHRWPAEDPAGKRVTFDQGKTWTTIVGVVGDVKEYGLERRDGRRDVSSGGASRLCAEPRAADGRRSHDSRTL